MSAFFKRMFGGSERTHSMDAAYAEVVALTAGMMGNREAKRLAKSRGLQILDLTWEDTGRYQGSAVGPNISDMTIQVCPRGGRPTCMPVIRYPNFRDKSCDVALDDVLVCVGNEAGLKPRRIALREYLGELRRYLSRPDSWTGSARSLLAERDRDVLVSAQACFLPVPAQGEAAFNPVLFNYQSVKGSPAVLAILVTREGTSATIIDNVRDGFGAGGAWGQRLFFNQNGLRASFKGSRLAEFAAQSGVELGEAKKQGLNQVLLIQVPLKQRRREYLAYDEEGATGSFAAAAPSAMKMCRRSGRSDVDEAVISHGEVEGPFTEIDGLPIERDERFPIRVTVQLYQATGNGVVDASDIARLAQQIEDIYRGARSIGSLVLDGESGRTTGWGATKEPSGWWDEFWRHQERATGKSRHALMADLTRLLGREPSMEELEEALKRVFGGQG